MIGKENEVISVVKVESEDGADSFYATSLFSFEDGLIDEMTEYWGDNGELKRSYQNSINVIKK